MANLETIERALKAAHAAGNMDDARKLAAVVRRERQRREADPMGMQLDQVGGAPADPTVPATIPQQPDPTLGQQALGALEAGASMATGAVGGTVGMVGGAVEGVAKEAMAGEFGTPEAADRIEQNAMERAGQLTMAPQTPAGINIADAVGQALAPLAAVGGLAQTATVASQAGAAARQAATATGQAAKQAGQSVKQAVDKIRPSAEAKPADRSMGAAAVPMDTQRVHLAEELGFTGDKALTKGQQGRSFEDQRFERETAKMPDEGAEIRERFENQNARFEGLMDEFIDSTGTTAKTLEDTGLSLDKALTKQYEAAKNKVRVLYKEAEKAGEMENPIAAQGLVDHINASKSLEGLAGNLSATRKELIRIGAAVENEDGSLTAKPVSLKDGELVRQFIGEATDQTNPREARQAVLLKKAYDADTEELGGQHYKKARRARRRMAQDFENASLVDGLLSTKRGASDRKIALEKVLDKVILSDATSRQQMGTVSRLVKKTPEGRAAWADMQAATLQHIRDEMFKNVATNQRGERMVSPAALEKVLTKLDRNGKLDHLFGKRGAEKLRTANEVAKIILTAPPGAVNTSNTATVLAGLIDLGTTSMTGIPAPVASGLKAISGKIKDAKLKARIKKTLGE